MSSEWRPDDSLLERDETGELKGTRLVKEAFAKAKFPFADRVVTSVDAGIDEVRAALKRRSSLPGVEQWQMPILIDDNHVWIEAHHAPEAEIPEHSHEGWVLHIVISGALEHQGRTLNPGDWILVPPGHRYSLKVIGPGNARTCYVHLPAPGPPGPPQKLGSGGVRL